MRTIGRGTLGASVMLATAVAGASGAAAQCAATSVPPLNIDDIKSYGAFAKASIANSVVTTMNTVHLGSLAQSTGFVSSPAGAKADQQGAGSWSRVVGGSVEVTGTSTSQVTSRVVTDAVGNPIPPQLVATGTVECRTKVQQDFIANQFGFDIARHNFNGGANFHLGLTGGFTSVESRDKTAASVQFPSGGTYRSDSDIPFGGIYAALYAGSLSIDAQVRWDFIRSQFTDADLAAKNQEHYARSTAFLFNVAYRHNLPQNWFIEPSIGGVWSVAEIDPLSVPGQFAVSQDSSLSSPGTMRFQDVHSSVGRASIRLGTVITTGGIAYQPFVVASIFHEFSGQARSSFDGNHLQVETPWARNPPATGAGLTVSDARQVTGNITTSRVGTFGHIGAGIAGLIVDTGWLGYARIDYRSGEHIESFTANAGVRYMFVPPKDMEGASLKDGGTAAAPASVFDWTGLRVAFVSGALWGDSDWQWRAGGAELAGGKTHPGYSGYLYGVQVGYDHQVGRIVLGVAADYSLGKGEGGQSCPDAEPFSRSVFLTCETKVENLAFITGRVGYTWGRAMVYVRGGLAIGEVTVGPSFNLAHLPNARVQVPSPSDLDRTSSTQTGWVLGAGAEFALSDRWFASAEYLHFDLGSETFRLGSMTSPESTSPRTELTANVDTAGNVVRAGLIYRFGHREVVHEPLK